MKSITGKFIILFFAYLITVGASTYYQFAKLGEIADHWKVYLKEVDQKVVILSRMKETVGYGGAIHNFKNFLLRGTPQSFSKAQSSLRDFRSASDQYRKVGISTQDEKENLEAIERVFLKYEKALFFLKDLEHSTPVRAKDLQVKIDDSPAIQSFYWLDRRLQRRKTEVSQTLDSIIADSRVSILLVVFVISIVFLLNFFFIRKKIELANRLLLEEKKKIEQAEKARCCFWQTLAMNFARLLTVSLVLQTF